MEQDEGNTRGKRAQARAPHMRKIAEELDEAIDILDPEDILDKYWKDLPDEEEMEQDEENMRGKRARVWRRTCGKLPRSSTRRSTSSTPRTSLADGGDGSSNSDELNFGLSFELLSGRDSSNPETSVESMLGACLLYTSDAADD